MWAHGQSVLFLHQTTDLGQGGSGLVWAQGSRHLVQGLPTGYHLFKECTANVGTTHTTEYIRTDVGRAPPLVLQQVPLTHKMFPKAEVGDSYPMGPKNGRQRVNTESPRPRHLAGSGPYSEQKQPGFFSRAQHPPPLNLLLWLNLRVQLRAGTSPRGFCQSLRLGVTCNFQYDFLIPTGRKRPADMYDLNSPCLSTDVSWPVYQA